MTFIRIPSRFVQCSAQQTWRTSRRSSPASLLYAHTMRMCSTRITKLSPCLTGHQRVVPHLQDPSWQRREHLCFWRRGQEQGLHSGHCPRDPRALEEACHWRVQQPQGQHVRSQIIHDFGFSLLNPCLLSTNATNAGTPKFASQADAQAVLAAEPEASADTPLDPSGV